MVGAKIEISARHTPQINTVAVSEHRAEASAVSNIISTRHKNTENERVLAGGFNSNGIA